ncbi:MAG: nucleotide sugar dehydrogenase [Pseudonocardiaceae bacterium]|nr:nucleotide sugar dehydrogenase [Pseudonocardiaceae bacterium]
MVRVAVARIAVVGTGYVGLTTGACLARLGHRVTCADIDKQKVDRLRAGRIGILEPGLAELVAETSHAGRLSFVVGTRQAVSDADVVFLCVPTPMGADGGADLTAVEAVIADVGGILPSGCVLVTKSTVPVGTAARITSMLARPDVGVASNPEFLREGSAVQDFLHPDRIVVGSDDPEAAERVSALYRDLGAPTLVTDAASAEMVKYAANCFLAMKLSYVNSIAELCERVGADVMSVTEGMGHDPRIGRAFLAPGPGWGGSCLPKDTEALLRVAESVACDFELLRAAVRTNAAQRGRVVDKVRAAVGELSGARIGLLGLAFKAGTNDVRDSPALAVATALAEAGAELTGYDPVVGGEQSGMIVVGDPYQVAKGADAVVLLTEWPQFRDLDWWLVAELMDGDAVIDTRNHLPVAEVTAAGLRHSALGRTPTQEA